MDELFQPSSLFWFSRADGGSEKLVSTQFPGGGFHLWRRHALYVHLRQCANQHLLATLIALENLGSEPPRQFCGARNSKLPTRVTRVLP